MARAQKTTVAKMAKTLVGAVPDGWTVTTGPGYHDGECSWPDDAKAAWVKFDHGDGVVVVLNVQPCQKDSWSKAHAFEGLSVDGHTVVDGRCFTRRGVDCASCSLTVEKHNPKNPNDHDYNDLASLLAGELVRCQAARARRSTMVPVPGLPFNVQPDWFTKTAQLLKSGREVMLTPSGFGTGYRLSRKQFSRLDRRATAALEKAIGFAPIFVAEMDCD